MLQEVKSKESVIKRIAGDFKTLCIKRNKAAVHAS